MDTSERPLAVFDSETSAGCGGPKSVGTQTSCISLEHCFAQIDHCTDQEREREEKEREIETNSSQRERIRYCADRVGQ